jgi:endogenous inhibitor of DNA gyrase (YacG/DUF329 family)
MLTLVCSECGAAIEDHEKHAAWHQRIIDQFLATAPVLVQLTSRLAKLENGEYPQTPPAPAREFPDTLEGRTERRMREKQVLCPDCHTPMERRLLEAQDGEDTFVQGFFAQCPKCKRVEGVD